MKIALIIPYFGSFPNYFQMWLISASYANLDFFIFSDADASRYEISSNVHIKEMTFEEVKEKIKRALDDKEIALNDAYKLCEYRISYGKIFQKELAGYDFWGYCDIDLIWGQPFYGMNQDEIFNAQRLFTRGHFCLYKNDSYSRELYRRKDLDSFFRYPYAYRTNYECHYDELYEWNQLIEKDGRIVYTGEMYADIDYRYFRFRLAERNDDIAISKQIYMWEKGHLYRYYLLGNSVCKNEVNYIHLQKRPMEMQKDIDYERPILIAPNVIKNFDNIDVTKSVIEMYSSDHRIWMDYYIRKIKWDWKKIKNGGMPYKIQLNLYRLKRKKRK